MGTKLHLSQTLSRVSSLLARSARSGRCYYAIVSLGRFSLFMAYILHEADSVLGCMRLVGKLAKLMLTL